MKRAPCFLPRNAADNRRCVSPREATPIVTVSLGQLKVMSAIEQCHTDPKHLGARIGTTLVPHTWGFALDAGSSSASTLIWPTPMLSLTGSCRCASVSCCS